MNFSLIGPIKLDVEPTWIEVIKTLLSILEHIKGSQLIMFTSG